jgi:hypothetical protein
MSPIPNNLRDTAILLYNSKTVTKKDLLLMFLIPAFIVLVTEFAQFT